MTHTPHPLPGIQVATAGEALIDMICGSDGRYEPCIGGAVYNLTRALARQGLATLYLNPLSRDRFGRLLANGLARDGVHLAVPAPVLQSTSLAVVNVDANGHPDYAFYREGVADRAISAEQLNAACASARGLQAVCTGALALAPADAAIYLPWLQTQARQGTLVVVDANLRPSVMPDLQSYRSHVLTALQHANLIKVSDEDLDYLNMPGSNAIEQARMLLRQTPASCVALTRGAQGASLLTRGGQIFHAAESTTLTVVDTVGAGDCFLAGLVTTWLEAGLVRDWGERSVTATQARDLLAHAVASASLCVQQRGCTPPTRAEVRVRVASTELLWQDVEVPGASSMVTAP